MSQTERDLRIYLINLDRASGRLAYMDGQLRALGLDYERFAAIDRDRIDASIPEFDATGYARKHGRNFNSGEVACFLSHAGVLRRFLEGDGEFALVLEDDAKLPNDIGDILAAAIARADEWDLLRLSTVNDGIRVPYSRLTDTHHFAIALTREKGAAAYVINRRCAEMYVDKLLPIRLAWDIAFDTEYRYGLKSVFVEPPPIDQSSDFESQIQKDAYRTKLPRTRYITVFPYRAWLEGSRFVIRGLRLLRLRIAAQAGPRLRNGG